MIQIHLHKSERKLSELGMIGLEMSMLNSLCSFLHYSSPNKKGTKPHVEHNLHFDISS